MSDAVNGFVRGHTVVLEAALPELEGRRVRVTVEALDEAPQPAEGERDELSILPPMAQLIGRSVVSTSPDGSVELAFEGSPRFANRFGSIQGGMLSAMLDSTLAYSAMAALQPGQRALTVEMSTRFFQPATPGRLRARASLLHLSKNLAHAQADLY
ncbi:MAG TPA: PaaI family thioesterase, partial [Polyangiales bacterium]|nr:PaaI family thioesterase [Polyangiales bacterium]